MRTKVTILLGIFMSTLVLVGCMYDEPSIQTGDYPFVKEGKRWNCRNGGNDFVYKMMGDTSISSKAYKKLYVQYSAKYGNDQWHYQGAVREKGEQVYMLEAGEKKEYLLYDFGVGIYDPNVGLDYFTNKDGNILTFRAIEPYKNTNRRLYSYDYQGERFMCGYFHWLEGVGDLDIPFPIFTGIINSCYEDDVCIYEYDENIHYRHSSRNDR